MQTWGRFWKVLCGGKSARGWAFSPPIPARIPGRGLRSEGPAGAAPIGWRPLDFSLARKRIQKLKLMKRFVSDTDRAGEQTAIQKASLLSFLSVCVLPWLFFLPRGKGVCTVNSGQCTIPSASALSFRRGSWSPPDTPIILTLGKEVSQHLGLCFQSFSRARMPCPPGPVRHSHVVCVLNRFAFQDVSLE